MGAILSQQQEDGYLHPITFMSQTFKPAELNYDTYNKELLAIITAFRAWCIYLEGTKELITVYTDHHNPVWWKDAKEMGQ